MSACNRKSGARCRQPRGASSSANRLGAPGRSGSSSWSDRHHRMSNRDAGACPRTRWPLRGLCWALLLAAAAGALALGMRGPALAALERSKGVSSRIGGVPIELLSARGSLWVLTCDHSCAGEGRGSVGRVVRVDPRIGRTIRSGAIDRPGAIAVGAGGVFATDFWRHRIRRVDPVTLQQTASLDLVLPSRIASQSKYAAFLPNDVAVGQGAVWISTEWCTVARADQQLTRALATVQLPCDAYQTMAFGAGSLWISESLAGLYRIDAARNRVTARLLL